MSYARYVRTCLADDARFLYPMTPGNTEIDRSGYASPLISSGSIPLPSTRPRSMMGAPPMLGFDGAQQRSSASTSTNFYNAAFTLECWAWLTATGAQNVLVSCATSGSPVGHMFDIGTGFFRFFVGDTVGGGFLSATFDPATYPGGILNRRLHLVGATDGARADFWINGQIVATDVTTAGTRFTTTPTLWIGRYNSTTTAFYNGGLALVSGYHRYDPSLPARHYAAARAGIRHPLGRAA